MRILATVGKAYYGRPHAVEPMYLEFTGPPRSLGHDVEHFDHMLTCARLGPEACGEQFLSTVRAGRYDLVIYQTAGRDWMPAAAIRGAARHAPIVAWNSDDDWQWQSYTRHRARDFSHMITTYPHIYEANRSEYPNLLFRSALEPMGLHRHLRRGRCRERPGLHVRG
jgi:hypothetical protein